MSTFRMIRGAWWLLPAVAFAATLALPAQAAGPRVVVCEEFTATT
jgi:hypothetical protein